jgi:hypothetical protein
MTFAAPFGTYVLVITIRGQAPWDEANGQASAVAETGDGSWGGDYVQRCRRNASARGTGEIIRAAVSTERAEGPRPGPDVGHRPGHRQHHRDRGVHDAGGAGQCRHQLADRARRDSRGRDAARGAVRPADPARSQLGRRPVRLRPARVRRLRRLSHRLVLLGPGLGRQRGHRGLLGLLRGGPLRHQPSIVDDQLGNRPAWPVDPGRD